MFERPQNNLDEPSCSATHGEDAPLGDVLTSHEAPSNDRGPGFDIQRLPGLQSLWAETLGDPDVMIAVLDGPVDLAHECFRDAMISGPPANSLPQGETVAADPLAAQRASAEHGTHVASVIFAQHGCGVTGVAPRCRGVIVPVFHRRTNGTLAPCSQIDLARAITQAVQLADEAGASALVINISGGQYADSGQAHPLLADVIRQCDPQRVMIVAAAGNQGCDCLHIPGAIPSVLVVGAMDAGGAPMQFSNWGSAYRNQGILAPGENIVGALPAGGVIPRTGTSFATPIASGVAALLLSRQIAHGHVPDAAQVRAALLQGAVGCERQPADDCRRLLGGRLSIEGAVALLANPAPNLTTAAADLPSLSRVNVLSSETELSLSPGEYTMSQTAHAASQPAVLASEAMPSPDAESHDTTAGSFNSSQSLRQPVAPAAYMAQSTAESPASNDFRSATVGSANVSGVETVNAGGVLPSDCGCGGKCGGAGQAPPVLRKVFALGRLSFDYGTRARRQYFLNEMRKTLGNEFRGVDDPATLYNYLTRVDKPERRYTILDEHRFTSRAEVVSLTWVLSLNDTPIYAIMPMGAFAHEIHDLLVSFLNDQLTDGAERVSLPGIIVGSATLFTGEPVQIVQPDIRGMFSWKTSALVDLIQKQAKGDRAAEAPLQDFLNRVYSRTDNLGLTSEERAINFAATDALMNAGIFRKVRKEHAEFEFDDFSVHKSAICRPDADCWDVVLYFYDPTNLMRARRAVRYTIDVADVVPIMVGEQREYSVR